MRDARGKRSRRRARCSSTTARLEQKKRFGEIEGNLAMRGGAGISANTTVELVDEDGEVVQRAVDRAGNYRFKNVTEGKYKVRATKAGCGAGGRGRAPRRRSRPQRRT